MVALISTVVFPEGGQQPLGWGKAHAPIRSRQPGRRTNLNTDPLATPSTRLVLGYWFQRILLQIANADGRVLRL